METGSGLRFQSAVDSNNKRANKAGAVYNLTVEQFEAAYIYFGGKCAYSGQTFLKDSSISIEHIIPILSGGHSMAFNCIPVSAKYNSSKSGYHLLDWWKCQSDAFGNSIYNPFRLLKVLNYMIKCLESVNMEDPVIHVLSENEIDKFLFEHRDELECNTKKIKAKDDFKKISQLEMLRKMDMIRLEDLYSVYSELENIRLNVAIFFEETLHELEGDIPNEVLASVSDKIHMLPDLYIDGKKVFKKEMNPEDVKIRQQVLKWAEEENLENKYGIVGYMNFEVLKKQNDVFEFLKSRKMIVIEAIGANEKDFNNVINKVPNILTNMSVQNRIDAIARSFNIDICQKGSKNSEMYKYIVNKPDLLLSGENMEILLKYAEKLKIDKRLLKRGVSVSTLIDNIEMAIELVKNAELNTNQETKKRILNKLINGTTGNLLRDAFRSFKKFVEERNEEMSTDEIKRDASRWIVCISEKYNSSDILKTKCINKTKGLYSNMRFNEEGFMVGVNPNAYIVPEIISLANLEISKVAESELIDNVFFVNQIRQGMRADIILRDLAKVIKKDEPEMETEEIMMNAARWFIFLSESSQVHLSVMFDSGVKDKYIEITKKYYRNMKFDEKGNFIDQNIPELSDLIIGVDYIERADSYFKSSGDYYIIKGRYIPKAEIQAQLYEGLLKCKNKKQVKVTCIRLMKKLSEDIGRKEGDGFEK